MKKSQNQRNDKGITLVALIITIIILVILAAVSISAVYNSKIVDYAVNGATGYAGEAIKENEIMSGTESLIDSTVKKIEYILGREEKPTPEEPTPIVGPNGKTLVTTLTDIQESKVEAEDKLGNSVTVPAGFKYKEGEIAEKGIVIEDSEGNQFVWVPVSNINHDGTNKIKRENGTEVEITLGRYNTFNTTTGEVITTAGTYQYAANYADETSLGAGAYVFCKEIKNYRESNKKTDTTGTNTTAKNLKGFIDSTNLNKGYYIARYEASYGSGNNVSDWKPLSKVSIAKSDVSMNYVKGTLWNCNVTQTDAAKICQNMYTGNVNSDLINSYAWDTAIIYIQLMENNDYGNKKDGNGTLKNTGETGDKVCNIFDMSGNLHEWTTEYSTSISAGLYAFPCIYRGGYYVANAYATSTRGTYGATGCHLTIGFRILLYV